MKAFARIGPNKSNQIYLLIYRVDSLLFSEIAGILFFKFLIYLVLYLGRLWPFAIPSTRIYISSLPLHALLSASYHSLPLHAPRFEIN